MRRLTALLRQRVRRDWLELLPWIVGTALMAYAGYAGVTQSYSTLADRQNILAAAVANPVILMFRGLPSGPSEGAFLAFEILPWLAILAALMTTFLAVRHTRGDEEAGRTELLSATPAGRTMPTLATIVHGVLASVVLAILTALALISTGLGPAGSWLAGAAAGATGIAFLGIGLIAAQLARTSRAANSITIWVLVGTFLLRGIGNAAGTPSDDLTHITSSWPAWISPFGWAEQTRPFDEGTWWPVLLAVGVGLGLSVLATVLQSVRDIDASFLVGRQGRVHARPALSTSHALVWRLASGSIIGWAIGGALTGILATSLGGIVDQVAGSNPAVADIITKLSQSGSIDEAVVTVFFTMLGIVAGCCAVQTVVRARQEEAHGTAEPVLGTLVGRVRWLADYLIVASCAVLIIVVAAVAAGFLGLAAAGGDGDLYRTVLVDGGGEFVAASVFTVVTALVFVLLPRATIGLAWALR
ncbi:ABC transporter permease [Microbacterium elymi]|uniref:Polyketide antibiotic transporter n=1 Tax=Microbacterium elymi TaxID=2909587 RepID=A0ABY5NH90_9MICO|nr:polyketide antibiotic transporter [Microbacterium elymi]UUT34558.1 polyketide antibiotic transporter [Microbacterium elymi]